MYIRDLAPCRYHGGPFDARNWSAPLLAVGWLQFPFPFKRAVVAPEFVLRLNSLVQQAAAVLGRYNFLGTMSCPLWRCRQMWGEPQIWSQENLFVPGAGVVYVAPGGIVHYVETHRYLPPSGFIEAVLRCPDIGSTEYWRALREANTGCDPPLVAD